MFPKLNLFSITKQIETEKSEKTHMTPGAGGICKSIFPSTMTFLKRIDFIAWGLT